jgi:hypothetical protein
MGCIDRSEETLCLGRHPTPLHLKIPEAQDCPAFGLVECIDLLIALHVTLDLGDPAEVDIADLVGYRAAVIK